MNNKRNIWILAVIVVMLFLYIFSIKETTAIVHITEINEHSVVVLNASGQKTKINVPRKISLSNVNMESLYSVDYYSNLFKNNTLKKIHKVE